MTIRAAEVADAARVADVHARSRAAYYGERLDPRDRAQDRRPMWLRHLSAPQLSTFVAVADEPVGFICVRRASAEDPEVELMSLYVLPERFGEGIGTALYEQFLAVREAAPASLEVWEANERAISFYRRRGWRRTTSSRPGIAGVPYVTWKLAASDEL